MAVTLKVALVSRTVFYAPVWVAERNGYFRSEGIEPRFEIFDNAEKINEVMRSGAAQIAIASVEALVADAFKGGKLPHRRKRGAEAAALHHRPAAHQDRHRPPRRPLRRAVAARGHHLFRPGHREGARAEARRHRHRRGRRRADPLEAPARGQDRRRPSAVPAQLRVEDAGFSNLGRIATYVPDYEFTAVFLDPAWAARQSAGCHRASCARSVTARPR